MNNKNINSLKLKIIAKIKSLLPGYNNIEGNEKVNQLAKDVANIEQKEKQS